MYFFLFLFLSCLSLNSTNLFGLADRYQLIDLGVLNMDSSEAASINNNSQVCGVYDKKETSYVYVWEKGGKSNYKSFKSPHRVLINNTGDVYGSRFNWVTRGLWELDQETIYKWQKPFNYFTYFNCADIGYPPTLYSTGYKIFDVVLHDINDAGELLVMDKRNINRNHKYQVWVYTAGKFKHIQDPCLSAAIRINNQSQMLGFYFERFFSNTGTEAIGRKTVIYDLKSQNISFFDTQDVNREYWGSDLNDLGEVAGVINDPVMGASGFFGKPGQVVEIPNFNPIALNNAGQIIGSILRDYDEGEPAIWENGLITLLKEMTSLIDNKDQMWDRLDTLTDINDLGEIIGQGIFQGKPHGFLLIPLSD